MDTPTLVVALYDILTLEKKYEMGMQNKNDMSRSGMSDMT